MDRYVFSGEIRPFVHDTLRSLPDFKPLNVLESQLNRRSIEKDIEYKKDGKFIFK